MRAFVTFATTIFALLGAVTLSPAQSAELEHVAVGVHMDYVRLVFHLDEPAGYEQLDMVENSARYVLDGVNASAEVLANNIAQLNDKHEPVDGLSFEQFDDGLLVVINFEDGGQARPQIKNFTLTPDSYGGHRIVMDVLKKGGVHQAATASADVSPPQSGKSEPVVTAEAIQKVDQDETEAVAASKEETRKSTNPFEAKSQTSEVDLGTNTKMAMSDKGEADESSQKNALKMEPMTPSDFPNITAAKTQQQAILQENAASLPVTSQNNCSNESQRLNAVGWSYFLAIELAECWAKTSAWQNAQTLYLEILDKDPDFHRARLALADIYARTGQISQAKKAYLHVVGTNPPAHVIKEIQSRMDTLGKPTKLPMN